MATSKQYDVMVVGGSIGGCTAAMLYARHGLRVVLVEQTSDPSHFKKVCTHFLQPVAMDAIRKLGLDKQIEAAGGQRNVLEVWTRWGWIRPKADDSVPCGYNIRRETLDPMLRELARSTPGVDYIPGTSARSLVRDRGGRVIGVECAGEASCREFRAPLIVAADGRNSRLAALAGVKARQRRNDRFVYFTYYRDLPSRADGRSRYWHLDPALAYEFPNDDGTTLLGIFLPLSELREFKKDPMGNFRRFWDRVPDGPQVGNAEAICDLRGMTQIPNQRRVTAVPGLAFVGDAAMVLDPIWGTGCSFAFASADWLVEATHAAFGSANHAMAAIDRGLKRYHQQHRSRTRGHYRHITSFSRIRCPSWIERLVFSAATRDTVMAHRVLRYVGRTAGLGSLLTPAALARAAVINLRYLLMGDRNARVQPGQELPMMPTGPRECRHWETAESSA